MEGGGRREKGGVVLRAPECGGEVDGVTYSLRMAGERIVDERAYVRAMFELMGRMAAEGSELPSVRGGPAAEDELRAWQRRQLDELERLVRPASLADFHGEYVALVREGLRRQGSRRGLRGPLPGDEADEQRVRELMRVLFAVATDEETALAGLPAEKRWEFVVSDGEPREEFIMVERDERDWREKLRAEMERRGIPERDIEEAMRRLERLRDAE